MPVPISGRGERGAPEPADLAAALPLPALEKLRASSYFLVENARSARAVLKAAGHPLPIAQLDIREIGHNPAPADCDEWLAPLRADARPAPRDAVVLAEAGCPGIADPGAVLAARAHALGCAVQPWVGPSAILLALMGAGMNGQRFRFLGYLPQDRAELRARLVQVQRDARSGETQVFIETPYRNTRLFESLLQLEDASLRLCVAIDLMGPAQALQTRTLAQWRALPASERPRMEKLPAVFLLHGGPS